MTASVGLSIGVRPRYRATTGSPWSADSLAWLTTPRVLALAAVAAIGGAGFWSMAAIVSVGLLLGVTPAAMLGAVLNDPQSTIGAALRLTPALLLVTAPTMLIWAIGAIGTRDTFERLRGSRKGPA